MGQFTLGVNTILAIFSYFIFRKIALRMLKLYLKDIQRTDCCGFNEDKYSKEKYFIRKFFIKKSKLENYHMLMSLIEEKKMLFNRFEDDLEGIIYKSFFFLIKKLFNVINLSNVKIKLNIS